MSLPDGFYEKKTVYGDILVKEYRYAGKILRQETLTVEQMMELSDILTDLDVTGLNDVTNVGNEVSIPAVIKSLVKQRSLGKVLSVLLWEDEGHPEPDVFNRGLADGFFLFTQEVLVDFFTFNPSLVERLIGLFVQIFVRAAETLASGRDSGMQSILSAAGMLQNTPRSETTGSHSSSSGSRSRRTRGTSKRK